MKKILLFCSFCVCGLTARAQYYVPSFVTYQSLDEIKKVETAPIQTIYGYIKTSNGWVRLSLKVQATEESVLVVGYKKKDTLPSSSYAVYGDSGSWRTCRSWANEVSVVADGRVVANNFDYKVSISGLGIVYF